MTPEDFQQASAPVKTCLITVPGAWTNSALDGRRFPRDGFATYRLLLKTGSEHDLLTLKTRYMFSAYKLWVNGQLLITRGVVGKSRAESLPRWAPDIVSFAAGQEIQEIVIQISNYGFSRSGFARRIILGTEKQIRNSANLLLGIDLFLFGSFVTMGIYHLCLFCFRRKEPVLLYFGLICLLAALRTVLMGEMVLYSLVPNLSIEFFLKASMLTIQIGLPLFGMSLRVLYPDDSPKWLIRLTKVTGVLFSAVTLFTPDSVNSKFLLPYEITAILLILGFLVIIGRAVIRKREGASIMAAGTGIFFLAAFNDVMSDIGLIRSPLILPFGVLALPFAQSLMLGLEIFQFIYHRRASIGTAVGYRQAQR